MIGRREEEGAEPRPRPHHTVGEALDTLSVDDLRERIAALRAEIVRLETAMDAKQASRHAADAFFKR